MKKSCLLVLVLVLAGALAGTAWAQMNGPGMMQYEPGQGQAQSAPQGPNGGYGYGPGMMGGYGGGYGPGMMGGNGGGYGPGMMGGYGGGYGPGMMGMMMDHMMGGGGLGMGPGMMWGPGLGMGMGYALPYLDLTPDQRDKVRKLAYENLQKIGDLYRDQYRLRLELYSLQSSDKLDANKVRDLFAKQAAIQAEIYLAGADYLGKVKGLLTKEQLKKLENWRY